VTVLPFIFGLSLLAIASTYVVYPLLLVVRNAFRPRQRVMDGHEPTVSLVISAYNEATVIRQKLQNSLALDYPTEKLEVMLISDASDDGTDSIAQQFAGEGVRLCRQEARQGKSAALTRFVPHARGDIVVFSDANSMYEPDAIRKLVRHFRAPDVGYVVGCQKYYLPTDGTPATSEGLYWRYEQFLKRQESRASSVVGGDGAIYAIRKRLFQPLRTDDISDFVNPLQIVAIGYRGVHEPHAVCYEAATDSLCGEFRRKARIVNRSVRGLFRVPSVMQPWRAGWFAVQVILHKFVRWLVPLFLLAMFVSAAAMARVDPRPVTLAVLVLQVAFYGLALLGIIPVLRRNQLFSVPVYFCAVNLAAGWGLVSAAFGRRFTIWNPERTVPGSAERGRGEPHVIGASRCTVENHR